MLDDFKIGQTVWDISGKKFYVYDVDDFEMNKKYYLEPVHHDGYEWTPEIRYEDKLLDHEPTTEEKAGYAIYYSPCRDGLDKDTAYFIRLLALRLQRKTLGEMHYMYILDVLDDRLRATTFRVEDGVIPPEHISNGDWVDLRAAEDVEMKAGEFKLISLGIAMELPDGYEAHVVPRSSTFKNFGIIQTNSMGVIDNSYSGNNDIWKFPAFALRDTKINKNDRICQFRIVKRQPKFTFNQVDELKGKDRGGFGSTGIE